MDLCNQQPTTNSLNQTLKKRLAKSLMWRALLYGSEAWTLKKDDIRWLDSFEMWVWRRMEKISRTERVRNEEVLRRVGEQRTLINTIWRRKAQWTGHVIQSEGLLRTVIEGRAEGKRPRGRKRRMMLDDIKQGRHTMPWKSSAEQGGVEATYTCRTCLRAEHSMMMMIMDLSVASNFIWLCKVPSKEVKMLQVAWPNGLGPIDLMVKEWTNSVLLPRFPFWFGHSYLYSILRIAPLKGASHWFRYKFITK